MLAPLLLAKDFATAIRNLLPKGRAWPRDSDTVQFKTWLGLGPTYERLTTDAVSLLADSFPSTTLNLLPEWEASLGLPDPCAGISPTIPQRRAQVVARFAADGGQSAAYFISYAAALGYIVTGVQNFGTFRVGYSHAGDPLNGQDWAYTFAIQAPLNTVNYFEAGVSAAGEPLAFWSNTVLECELQAIKPAHMILLFEYS